MSVEVYPQTSVNGTNNTAVSYFSNAVSVPRDEFVTTLASGYSTSVIDTGDGCRLTLMHVRVNVKSVNPQPVSSSSYTITVDATTPIPTNFNTGASLPAGTYTVTYQTGAWEWTPSGSLTPWLVGFIKVTSGTFLERYLRITGTNTVDSYNPNGQPERSFIAGDVGKMLRITGNVSGFVDGVYLITQVNSGVATLDRSPGTNGSLNGQGILYASDGTTEIEDMGISNTLFSTQAAAQAAAPPGQQLTYIHAGGPIGSYVVDGYYPDNINGSPAVTLNLVGPQTSPAVRFWVQTSDDLVNWFDAATSEDGAVSGPAEMIISFTTGRRYARIAWRQVGQTNTDPSYFPSGVYTLNYITGAYNQGGGLGWSPAVAATNGTTTEAYTDERASGTSITSEAACEAYYAGYTLSFAHYGGKLGIFCADANTSDNTEGSPPATWALSGASTITFLYDLVLTTIE